VQPLQCAGPPALRRRTPMKDTDLDSVNSAQREVRTGDGLTEDGEARSEEVHSDCLIQDTNPNQLHDQSWCCVPSSFQCDFKLVVLVCVVLQNSSYALVRRYSRGTLNEQYSANTVLIVMEITKLVFSMFQIVTSDLDSDVPEGPTAFKFLYLIQHSLTMLVPAALYLAMNILGFVALGRIDAGTFTVIAQMKVLSTALFSVALLGKQLSSRKWQALVLMTAGVTLITYESLPKANQLGDERDRALRSYLIGVCAVGIEVLLSGFVSIYFEKVLKSRSEVYSVWDRNFQLAFWSILIYTPIMMYENGWKPFSGWTAMATVCALVGSVGGLLVALTLKYADAILKTLATTLAVVLTTTLNAAFLEGQFTVPICTGALVVVTAVLNYNDDGDS